MKFLILLAIVFSVGTVLEEFQGRAMAQELNHLTMVLHLTSAQQNEIQPILRKRQDRIQALLATNPTLSRADIVPQIRALQGQTHREIEAVLTPSQQQLANRLERH